MGARRGGTVRRFLDCDAKLAADAAGLGPFDPVARPAMSSDPPAGPSRPSLPSLIAGAAVLFGLYVLCVGSISVNEALAGALSTGLAILWWVRIGRLNGVRFAGWFPAMRPLGGALLALPGATAKVAGQLARVVIRGAPQGAVAYRRESDSAWATAERPAERAFGLIAASLSPDSFILRDDGGDRGILDHALAREGGTP
jgi:hypothetical protein